MFKKCEINVKIQIVGVFDKIGKGHPLPGGHFRLRSRAFQESNPVYKSSRHMLFA